MKRLMVYWQYRGLIADLVRRDIMLKYSGSVLGSLWYVINPLVMIVIYSVIFSHIAKTAFLDTGHSSPLSYTIYLCAGLLPWNYLLESLLRGTRALLDNTALLKKIYLPLELFPLIVVFSGLVPFATSILLYLGLIIVSGHPLTMAICAFPVVLLFQMVFILGISYIFSTINVFFRDLEQLVNIGLQIVFWLTPVIYTVSSVPKVLQFIFYLNPMYYFIDMYHDIFFYGKLPNPTYLSLCATFAVFTFLFGLWMQVKLRSPICDEL